MDGLSRAQSAWLDKASGLTPSLKERKRGPKRNLCGNNKRTLAIGYGCRTPARGTPPAVCPTHGPRALIPNIFSQTESGSLRKMLESQNAEFMFGRISQGRPRITWHVGRHAGAHATAKAAPQWMFEHGRVRSSPVRLMPPPVPPRLLHVCPATSSRGCGACTSSII